MSNFYLVKNSAKLDPEIPLSRLARSPCSDPAAAAWASVEGASGGSGGGKCTGALRRRFTSKVFRELRLMSMKAKAGRQGSALAGEDRLSASSGVPEELEAAEEDEDEAAAEEDEEEVGEGNGAEGRAAPARLLPLGGSATATPLRNKAQPPLCSFSSPRCRDAGASEPGGPSRGGGGGERSRKPASPLVILPPPQASPLGGLLPAR